MQIDGNVFIVTGGASGLGGGTTRLLAANGGKVVIADVQADKGEALARELGANVRFVKWHNGAVTYWDQAPTGVPGF